MPDAPNGTSTRRYATRPSNEPNPAKKFGLAKRTKEEIAQAALQKRAEKDDRARAKVNHAHAVEEREARGARAIAAAMDNQLRQSRRDEEYGDVPSDDEEEDGNDSIAGSELDEARNTDIPSRPKKPSAAQQKQHRSTSIHHDINAHRKTVHLPIPRAPATSRKRKSDEDLEGQYKKTKKTLEGLAPGWKESTQSRTSNTDEADESGGLHDEDVTTSLEDALAFEPAGTSSGEMTMVVDDEQDEDEDSMDNAPDDLAEKTPRRPKTARTKEQSASFDALPEWIKPHFETTIKPSLIELYGSLDDAWEMDYGQEHFFFNQLQRLVRDFFNKPEFVLKRSTPFYRLARQSVHQWRAAFQKKANALIKDEIVKRYGGRQLRNKDAVAKALVKNAKEIKQYVSKLAKEWIWEHPDDEPRPTGALQSPYVLEVFANVHLNAIEGSYFDITDPPVAALALTAAALQRTIHAWHSGCLARMTGFSKDTEAAELTIGYRAGSIQRLINKGRFPVIIKQARTYMSDSKHARRLQHATSSGSTTLHGALLAYDPSSPIRPTSEDEGVA
ncbi:hypothetical protein BV25DRAFT_1837007 [Artomyces pyxidatus]|uniref:Uncharacterized protein n=1 Tax=Artomyces pyxidatus TaxID=48021 RepID=A0ACB8T8F2_9AGAM|nr:hypothetical protein BV25DRAFT_1837007 [Artomyces pyxidatus]